MTVLQLAPPIEVETAQGRGFAVLVETHADDQLWTVILNDSRAFITYPQKSIKATRSFTCGRGVSDQLMREILNGDRF